MIGLAETAYLKSLDQAEKIKRLTQFFKKQIPCVVITRNRHMIPEMLELAKKFKVPVFRTPMITSHFINAATIIVEDLISPRIRAQGDHD